MSKGVADCIAQRQAEAEAARIMGEAIAQAFDVLKAVGHDDPETVIGNIINADDAK